MSLIQYEDLTFRNLLGVALIAGLGLIIIPLLVLIVGVAISPSWFLPGISLVFPYIFTGIVITGITAKIWDALE